MSTTSGTPLVISVLSLVVAFIAVIVARSNLRRQIQVTSREAWMREFREQVAGLISAHQAIFAPKVSVPNSPESDLTEAMRSAQHNAEVWRHLEVIKLLVAEKGDQYDAFIGTLAGVEAGEALADLDSIREEAAVILRQERAAIAIGPGVWRRLLIRLLSGEGATT